MINAYLKLIGFGIGLTIIISVFSAIGVITQASDIGMIVYQTLAFLIAAITFTVYMKKKDTSLKRYGFVRKKVDWVIYLIIGVIVLIQPIVLGIDISLTFSTIALIILQMSLVGYTEEVLFRGIFFDTLKNKNPKTYILFSTIVFGFLHIASGLNPNTALALVIMQIVNAILLGAIFSIIYYLFRTIYLVIAFHVLFNIFAAITVKRSIQMNMISVLTLATVYVFTIVFLWFKKRKDTPISES